MRRVISVMVLGAGYSSVVGAQPAELAVDGVFGECNPVYAASGNELQLYREPDLESYRMANVSC